MKRVHVRLREEQYARLRVQATARGISMSAAAREAVDELLLAERDPSRRRGETRRGE